MGLSDSLIQHKGKMILTTSVKGFFFSRSTLHNGAPQHL